MKYNTHLRYRVAQVLQNGTLKFHIQNPNKTTLVGQLDIFESIEQARKFLESIAENLVNKDWEFAIIPIVVITWSVE